ncbi:MAG: FkbM family methyltransferase [Planctomycetota bacterium]|nr:FkbM family methyltransferase [Planctomycetota bacterium]
MFRKILAEFNFRSGRRQHDSAKLALAARQDRYNIRAAIELSRLGEPDAICQALMLTLAGLRDFAIRNEMADTAKDFMELALQQLEHSRGQCFQDIAALYFSGKKKNGFFVEVGTGNGEQLSNTFMLEKGFGWKGILFEPDRRFHDSIGRLRTAILDRRPVYCRDDEAMEFLEVSSSGELSTLSKFRRADGRFRTGSSHKVTTTTLNSALKLHNAPRHIDFLSVDAEGSELEVLQGLDFNQYSVGFLTIEHNFEMEKKSAVTEFLAPFGFKPVLEEFSYQDIWLVRN